MKTAKIMVNIVMAIIVCTLFFSPILMLLELSYLIPWIIPMGFDYRLRTMTFMSAVLILIFDLVMGNFYIATRKEWYRNWTYAVTFLSFGYIASALVWTRGGIGFIYLSYIFALPSIFLLCWLTLLATLKPKNRETNKLKRADYGVTK